MVRVGIIGTNFGRTVLVPAFRSEPRCVVTGLVGRDPERTRTLAKEAGIPAGPETWTDLIEAVDAVAIAVPPHEQPEIACAALERGRPVFLEKPLAADLSAARTVRQTAQNSHLPVVVDFEFTELETWKTTRRMLRDGAIGALRHVAASWQVENYATRMRLDSWKTSRTRGGGALGNLASHSLHYLEWFCGPITGLSARMTGLPGEAEPSESTVTLAFALEDGAGGSLSLSAASYLGSGHRLEFYGEEGTLVLVNPTTDYMCGFDVFYAKRPATELSPVAVKDALADLPDPRIAPVSRLVTSFIDAITNGRPVNAPSIREAYRVQTLIAAARQSHDTGRWVATGLQEALP